MKAKARIIAFYLPQFHPTEINDDWWGKGFTEWMNVVKAKPLFKGHYQPHIPTDLGFYDLRVPETREAQAQMAKEAGIEGFCYWHYWFSKDKQLLDRPFREVLESGKPDFPFCLGWANHSWKTDHWKKSKTFHKSITKIEQTYVKDEYDDHFYDVLPAFKDPRYIKVDGKPLFLIFAPRDIPDPEYFITRWQQLAKENGLNGIFFVGLISNLSSTCQVIGGKMQYYIPDKNEPAGPRYDEIINVGFDAVNPRGQYRAELHESGHLKLYFNSLIRKIFNTSSLKIYDYRRIIKHLFVNEDKRNDVFPTILPNWDRSPRSGRKANIYIQSTPDNFRIHLKDALNMIEDKEPDHKILFLMSWNEWAEGNYVEPDEKYGHGYLNVIREEVLENT